MLKRLILLFSVSLISAWGVGQGPSAAPRLQSAFLRVELAGDQPAFTVLSVDSLGTRKLAKNPLRAPAKPEQPYELRRVGGKFEYRLAGAPSGAPPAWTCELSAKQIRLHSFYSQASPPPSLLLDFDAAVAHATLLGLINEDGSVRLPALLHLPDHGTVRITSGTGQEPALGYDARRFEGEKRKDDYVKVTFPPATAALPQVDYTLDVVGIWPGPAELARDPRFNGFRRNWLNIFQLSPQHRALANNAASDVCAFTLFEYSAVAERTPPLAPGVTALDLVRQTLDRYLGGMQAYGVADPSERTLPYDFVDTYPSLVLAAWDYVRGSKDAAWLEKNYAGLKVWAGKMLAMDRDGQGLLEYPASGNSGSWWREDKQMILRPANWWDTIGFGHQDAYSNAIAYPALLGMAEMARQAKRPEDARLYASRAEKLRAVYYSTFYNPATGVLAGWKSADGKLHDYYFTFVNGMAITYGLVPRERANPIMDRLLAKMKAVGYTHFEYGLPGNLIPVRREDYVDLAKSAGGPEKEDGSDGFQIYENGAASGNFAYYTLEALYRLGRRPEADAMLFPMLRGYENGLFQGRGPNGKTYDWKAWDGTPNGYEGLLVDNYMTLLAVLSR
jgi:hypothetical protein